MQNEDDAMMTRSEKQLKTTRKSKKHSPQFELENIETIKNVQTFCDNKSDRKREKGNSATARGWGGVGGGGVYISYRQVKAL